MTWATNWSISIAEPARGKTIEFSVNVEDLSTGWTATATETDKSNIHIFESTLTFLGFFVIAVSGCGPRELRNDRRFCFLFFSPSFARR
jgi:hypothetical protein